MTLQFILTPRLFATISTTGPYGQPHPYSSFSTLHTGCHTSRSHNNLLLTPWQRRWKIFELTRNSQQSESNSISHSYASIYQPKSKPAAKFFPSIAKIVRISFQNKKTNVKAANLLGFLFAICKPFCFLFLATNHFNWSLCR